MLYAALSYFVPVVHVVHDEYVQHDEILLKLYLGHRYFVLFTLVNPLLTEMYVTKLFHSNHFHGYFVRLVCIPIENTLLQMSRFSAFLHM